MNRAQKPSAGAVASPDARASSVGREVLRSGGNAMDAAIAMNAVLTVVYPHMCGLGGDLFITFFDSSAQRLHCLNASGYAPRLASREALLRRGLTKVPGRGPLSATVPAAVAGWDVAARRFGSRLLDEVVRPAVEIAEDGFAVSTGLARAVVSDASVLKADELLSSWFLVDGDRPVGEHEHIRLPELASTLRRISEEPRDFYEGLLAHELVTAVEEAGGWLRADDLAEYEPHWVEPISVGYRGVRVFTTPPNSQGIAALEILNILTLLGVQRPGSAEAIDALVRAKRAAFADRDRYVGDPTFVPVPVEMLLSAEHAERSLAHAGPTSTTPSRLGGDTVYACAVDGDGSACSLIQSIYSPFGSAFVAGRTGILLHNRGHYFSLADNDPNRLEPRKRPLHTLMASIAMRGDRPWLVFGTMGADGQPQTNVQVLERVLAGESPAEAVAAPRVLSGRMWIEDDDDLLVVEDIGADAVAALRDAGHRLRLVPARDETMGHAHAIEIGADGEIAAGSDPRSDGAAYVL